MTQAILVEQTPTIQQTTNYSKFQFMAGNRAVDYNHVKKLKREMEANPELMATSPILVNEHYFVIDGQHRFEAAKELGESVYYIVKPGLNINTTRHLNSTQRRWTLMDFAKSFADSGNHNYRLFMGLSQEFPEIAPGIIRTYLAGGQRNGLDTDFRRGEFKIENYEAARQNIERLNLVRIASRERINAPMANALHSLMTGAVKGAESFDFDKLMRKLERETARELFTPVSSVRGCLRSIEDVYNFQSRTQTRLY